mmetsp:Transcript_6142/g.13997  ORF Transcript_6142/g.13997 Transcript_6142/m.13997 type:complete len:200 (-) Transcript_6142:19-618(-)
MYWRTPWSYCILEKASRCHAILRSNRCHRSVTSSTFCSPKRNSIWRVSSKEAMALLLTCSKSVTGPKFNRVRASSSSPRGASGSSAASSEQTSFCTFRSCTRSCDLHRAILETISVRAVLKLSGRRSQETHALRQCCNSATRSSNKINVLSKFRHATIDWLWLSSSSAITRSSVSPFGVFTAELKATASIANHCEDQTR